MAQRLQGAMKLPPFRIILGFTFLGSPCDVEPMQAERSTRSTLRARATAISRPIPVARTISSVERSWTSTAWHSPSANLTRWATRTGTGTTGVPCKRPRQHLLHCQRGARHAGHGGLHADQFGLWPAHSVPTRDRSSSREPAARRRRWDLVEGTNIRDHFNDGFVNTLSDSSVISTYFTNGAPSDSSSDRLDMQELDLPSSFIGDDITSITFFSPKLLLSITESPLPCGTGASRPAARFPMTTHRSASALRGCSSSRLPPPVPGSGPSPLKRQGLARRLVRAGRITLPNGWAGRQRLPLTHHTMGKVCVITGRRPVKGSIINRKGQDQEERRHRHARDQHHEAQIPAEPPAGPDPHGQWRHREARLGVRQGPQGGPRDQGLISARPCPRITSGGAYRVHLPRPQLVRYGVRRPGYPAHVKAMRCV